MPMFLFSLISTGLAGCPFGFDKRAKDAEAPSHELRRRLQTEPDFPSEVFTCDKEGGALATTEDLTFQDYEGIVAEIVAKYEATEDVEENNFNPRASFVGCIVRYAGHDFMDYRQSSGGGADGCVNFNDPDNVGLEACIREAGMPEVYNNWCRKVSLADFIVIMGEAVMARTATSYDADEFYGSGTLAQTFRDNFKFGRTTNTADCDVTGLMPNPEEGCKGLNEIFNENIFSGSEDPWKLTAAISGAHTVGSATIANSGYDGFWSTSDQQGVFNNDYFVSLLLKGWMPEIAVNGNPDKNQWIRSDIGTIEGHKEVMLDTDMCLIYGAFEPENNLFGASATDIDSLRQLDQGGQRFPDEPETGMCCAWVLPGNLIKDRVFLPNSGQEMCGYTYGDRISGSEMRENCCHNDRVNCNDQAAPKAPAKPWVYEFVKDEEVWVNAFVEAWLVATENGHTALSTLSGDAGETGPECEDDPDSLMKPKNPNAAQDAAFVCDDKLFRLFKQDAVTLDDPCTYASDFTDNKGNTFAAGTDVTMSKKSLGLSTSMTLKELCPKSCNVC